MLVCHDNDVDLTSKWWMFFTCMGAYKVCNLNIYEEKVNQRGNGILFDVLARGLG